MAMETGKLKEVTSKEDLCQRGHEEIWPDMLGCSGQGLLETENQEKKWLTRVKQKTHTHIVLTVSFWINPG